VAPNPVEGLSAAELKRLRGLTAVARKLDAGLRLLAEELPPAHPEAIREIVRGRLECVVNDYIHILIQSLEAAIREADPEAES